MAADPYGAGQNFARYLRSPPTTIAAFGQPLEPSHAPSTAGDFLRGLFGAARLEQPAARAAQPAAKPAAAKPAAAKPAAAAQQPSGPPTFEQIMQAYAGANGGKISLREIGALADIQAKTTATHRVPSIADIAGQRALDLGDQLTNARLEQAKQSGSKDAYLQALQEQQDRLERIARARAIDPVSAANLDGN